MKYSYILFFSLLIMASNLMSQNLVQNPSFEDTIRRTTPLFLPIFWDAATLEGWNYFTPLNNTIDYRSSAPSNFAGFQNAQEGDSYMGIQVYRLYPPLVNQREYAQNTLSKTLEKDSIYCLRLYMSMADSMIFASKNQLGIYFSATAVSANNRLPLPYTPQIIISPDSFNTDKENWTEYNFGYIAEGGERYMTVGNFNDTNSLDTMFVGGGNQFWMESSYYYLDNFYLGHCDSLPSDTPIGLVENTLERQVSVYPNPTKNELFIHYQGKEKLQIRLFDLMGKKVSFASISTSLNVTNEMLLSVAHLPKGLYFLEVVAGENRISKKIIKQ